MSRQQKALLIAGIMIALALVAIGAGAAARFYLGGAKQQSAAMICGDRRGVSHVVTIEGGRVRPESVSAHLCDELTLLNKDAAQRRLAFGEHDHHVAYDGADGRLVGQGETLTLVLSEAGEFVFHDHFDETVHGHFTVTK